MNETLLEVMEELFTKQSRLSPKSNYLQALRIGISQADINLINRWSDDLRSGKSSSHLYASYAQQDLLNDVYKRYTSVQ